MLRKLLQPAHPFGIATPHAAKILALSVVPFAGIGGPESSKMSTRTPNARAKRSKFKNDPKPPALVPIDQTCFVPGNVGTSRARNMSMSLPPQKYVGLVTPLT